MAHRMHYERVWCAPEKICTTFLIRNAIFNVKGMSLIKPLKVEALPNNIQ
jgi:hypothetical protein